MGSVLFQVPDPFAKGEVAGCDKGETLTEDGSTQLSWRNDAMMAATRADGISHMLCIGVDLETFPRVRELAERHADVPMASHWATLKEAEEETGPDTFAELLAIDNQRKELLHLAKSQ